MKRCKMSLLLLLLLVGINGETLHALGESPVEGGGQAGLEPSRASIYRHLLTEQENVKGAGEHIRTVFDGLVANVHELIETDVLPNLQLQVDDVVDHAEETWVNAGNAMRTAEVRSCIESSEADAQQVAKRAVEKMRGCADALQQEGDRRGREATRLLNQIDAMTKRFIGALETCVKDAEAAGWEDPTTEASTPDPAPTPSSAVEEDPETAVEDIATASICSKKSADDTSCSCPKCTKEEGSQLKEKCRGRGKCEKGKNKDQKIKEKNENENTEYENVDSNISKSKTDQKPKDKKGKKKDGKQEEAGEPGNENEEENLGSSKSKKNQKQKEKKGKKKEGNPLETGETENAEEENVEQNISTKEGKEQKEKHGKKKERKGKKDKSKDSYETKGRKSRKLLGFEEDPEEPLGDHTNPIEENSNDAQSKWRTQGVNPEEQFVIKCMQSPLLKELIDEKTRVYEKLEWMLNRVQEKEQGAHTLCIDEHLNKAQLKMNAIKTRMASCAERYMREEL